MKSYFAMGIFVALAWLGVASGARAQQPNFSSPSLLPLPNTQPEYPSTAYPSGPEINSPYAPPSNTAPQYPTYSAQPTGAYQSSGPAFSNLRGPANGYRTAQGTEGTGAGPGQIAPGQIVPEHVPTPAKPDSGPHDWSPSPSDKVEGYENGHSLGSGNGNCNDRYLNAMSAPYGAVGEEGDCGYGSDDMTGFGGGMVGCGAWYGGAAGLIMGRDWGNSYFWSFYDSNEAGQFLRQEYNWGGGVQAKVGHSFRTGCGGCGCCGVEAVYWGLYPGVSTQTTFAGAQPGNLNAILNFNQLNYNGGLASLITNGASAHRLQAGYEIHNVEVNLINFSLCGGSRGCGGYDCGNRFSYNFGAGARWFYFRDTLQFAADRTGANFNGAVDELYYDIETNNHLIGFQLLGQGNYWATNKLALTFGSKFGVFGNYISHASHIYGAAGDAVINNGPNVGRAWNVAGDTSTVAFLGELDFGFTYAMTCHWSLYAGYRVVGLTNVALTTNQVYHDLRGINDVEIIDNNGSLILHGGYAGVQFCW